MPPVKILEVRDFRGGLNLRADAFELEKNESPDLLNVTLDPRGGVEQRRGVSPFNPGIGNPNFLTANEASVETSTDDHNPAVNCTLSLATDWAARGSKSLRVTSVAAGDMQFGVTLGIPVTAGQTYSCFVFSKAVTTPRNVRVIIYWYEAALSPAIGQNEGSNTTNSTAHPMLHFCTATAPPGANFMAMYVIVSGTGAAGEAHDFDCFQASKGYNTSAFLHPDDPLDVLPGSIQQIFQYETLGGIPGVQQKQQILLWTTPVGVVGDPVNNLDVTKEGTIWYVDLLDLTKAYAIGAYRKPRSVQFKDKMYTVGNDDYQGRIGYYWNGQTRVALGTNFNDNYQVPTDTNLPSAKYIATFQGCVWVGSTTESGVQYPNRVRWSHPNFAGDWHSLDYIDIDVRGDGDVITGLVPLHDRLLVFKRHGVFAITGTEPDNFQVYPISREVGAVNQEAIVSTDLGVYFFAWPDGLMLYDGKNIKWQFERLQPLVQNNMIYGNTAYATTRLGWSGRRLWLSVPWRADAADTPPTSNTRTFVLDPTLTKDGSWVQYDLAIDPMMEWKPLSAMSLFIGAITGQGRMVNLEPSGDPSHTDNFGDGPEHIESYYRTRWYDADSAAVKKRWKRPEIVLHSPNVDSEINVEVFRDYDPTVVERTFNIGTGDPVTVMEWGDPWGELWGPISTDFDRSEIVRGSSLGNARAVQLKFKGPTTDVGWGLNSLSLKYIPRPVRS